MQAGRARRAGPGRPDVTFVVLDGRASAYTPGRGELVTLNESATEIWLRCDGRSVDEVVDELSALTSLDPERLTAEVLQTLDEFVRLGLVASEE